MEFKVAVHVVTTKNEFRKRLLERFSTFLKLQRCVAIMQRYIKFLKGERIPGELTEEELERARIKILQLTQL